MNLEQYSEASSPKDTGELEGVYSAFTLAIIEEADKDDVDHDVIEAMDEFHAEGRTVSSLWIQLMPLGRL